MMYKFEINFEQFTTNVFVAPQGAEGSSATLQRIRGYASEFRTHCIVTGKPYNTPHFINWMNKYYPMFRMTRELPTLGRIDL